MRPYAEAVEIAKKYVREQTTLSAYNDIICETSVDDIEEIVVLQLENYDSLTRFHVRVQFNDDEVVSHEVY